MNKDVLVVEDSKDQLEALCTLIKSYDLNPIGLDLPSSAKRLLEKREELPFAYFIDMRIPAELTGSENLFQYIKSKGPTDNFYFLTADLSKHDQQVLDRTGANHRIKSDYMENLIEELAKQVSGILF